MHSERTKLQKKEIQNRLHGIFKSCRNFKEFDDKIWIVVTVIYGLSWPKFEKKWFFLAQININEHFVIEAGPTSELVENRAALKILLLLMKRYDLCDENFYNNDDKKYNKQKIKVFKPIQDQN